MDRKMEIAASPAAVQALSAAGIDAKAVAAGVGFTSSRGLFRGFTVTSALLRIESGTHAGGDGIAAAFPGAACRLLFAGGSLLIAYPSGHIRWVTKAGLDYYRLLSRGQAPAMTQGDLVLFPLGADCPAGLWSELADALPADQGAVWCRASPPMSGAGAGRHEAEEVALGGNRRHRAVGRLRWRSPVPGDHRTLQIRTLDAVTIVHDPPDAVHPTLRLPAGTRWLVTKLPGFSDPAREMAPCAEVLP